MALRTREARSRPAAVPEQAPAPAQPPVAVPAPSPEGGTARAGTASPERLRRQTLDLPGSRYRELHRLAVEAADAAGVTSRQLNAQTVLRALVARMLDDPELTSSVLDDVRRELDAGAQ